jgi:hypothetical protein
LTLVMVVRCQKNSTALDVSAPVDTEECRRMHIACDTICVAGQ